MVLPVVVRNSDGKKASIELNNNAFVVCRFYPNNSVYLGDAQLKNWYPENSFLNIVYIIKKYLSSAK